MNILITGAKGFVGKNLCATLHTIQGGKNRTRPAVSIGDIYEYDIDTEPALLDEFCAKADFVFNLAGVNRPKDQSEFMEGNFGFASTLLDTLKKNNNLCPVMLSSSIQAVLDNPYGGSKKAGEELFLRYGDETGAKVLVYRFPNVFGKWCRPNYNSVVATFCHNYANDLPVRIDNRATELELVYIDDLVAEMLDALEGKEHRCHYDGVNAIPAASAGNVIGGGDFAEDRIIPDCIRAVIAGKEISVRNPYSTRPYQHVLDPLFAYLMIAAVQYEDNSIAGCYNVGPDEEDCYQTGKLVELFCRTWGENASWIDKSDNGPHEANFLKLDCSKLKLTFAWKPRWNIAEAIKMTVAWTKNWLSGQVMTECMAEQVNAFLLAIPDRSSAT